MAYEKVFTAEDFCASLIAGVWSMKATAYKDTYPLNCLYYWGNGKWSADCNNLYKCWIWSKGELPKTVGKYVYAPNRYGLGDLTCKQLIDSCSDVSTDFSKIQKGELLYIKGSTDLNGHIGIYVGDYQVEGKTFNVIEASPIWYNGIQSTYVDSKGRRIRPKTGEQSGVWEKHGKAPNIDYGIKDVPLKYTISTSGNTQTINVIEGKGTITITTQIK